MQWQKIQEQINNLTSDEDKRQDLWTTYLSGNTDLGSSLKQIQAQHDELEQFKHELHKLIVDPILPDLYQILESFEHLERSVLYWLILGYNKDEISRYKGISLVRVEQIIYTIQKSERWNQWPLSDTFVKTRNLVLQKKKLSSESDI